MVMSAMNLIVVHQLEEAKSLGPRVAPFTVGFNNRTGCI